MSGSLKDLGDFAGPTSVGAFADVILVTPSNTVDTAKPFRALRATVAGTIAIVTAAGNTVTCAFLAGETRQIAGSRVMATNTTATGIEAMT